MAYYSDRVIKEVINRNFTFGDVSKKFENVDESTGNIFCPFHENTQSPAARMYWDEDRELWVLHCFGECHKTYTTYDYVDLVLCHKFQKYKTPLEFLKKNMNADNLNLQLSKASKGITLNVSSYNSKIKTYIENVSSDSNTIEEYIETLYNG